MALIIVPGNIGRDAEYSEKDGRGMARFSVAESEKVNGEKVTKWYGVTVFGKSAEFARDWCKKGRIVQVTGRPVPRYFKNKFGEDVAAIDIIATDIKLLGGSGAGENGPTGQGQHGNGGYVEVGDEEVPF